tara:strand:- start:1341 stop:1652 length:312 start_codon:yes stop_codon:yes gene_type:complete
MNKVLLLITTVPNQLLANKIAKELIESELAACISIKQIQSIYKWQGDIEENKEFEITIKSLPKNLNKLTLILKSRITYEVPQLIYKIFDSENSYFQWIKESIN